MNRTYRECKIPPKREVKILLKELHIIHSSRRYAEMMLFLFITTLATWKSLPVVQFFT